MLDPSLFTFKIPIQMRWSDLDPLGHVNNAVFVSYFEVARGHYMIEACPGWDWTKHMFLIANIEVQFQKELLLNAPKAEAWIRTSKLGNKSFKLEYVIVSQTGGVETIHATGSSVQVMIDLKSKSTVQIEPWVKDGLTSYEKDKSIKG